MDNKLTDSAIKEIHNEFPVFRKYLYMNTGWCAPRSNKVQQSINDFCAKEIENGVANMDMWKLHEAVRNSVRSKTALLFGADEDEIAVTLNTSSGINTIVTCLEFRPSDEIIISSEEHPAGVVPWIQLKKLKGVDIRVVKTGTRESFLKSIKNTINKKTKLIMLSHVSCMSGFRFPVKEIAAFAKEKGVPFLVDGAQSAGHIDVNLKELGCDFFAAPGQKWMLGPESTGFMYIRREQLQNLNSINAGYRSIKSYDAEKLEMELQPTAKRFEMFDTNCSLLSGLETGIDILNRFGMKAIEERIKGLAKKMINGFSMNRKVSVLSPVDDNGKPDSGLVAMKINDFDAGEAVKELFEKHRIIARHFKKENIIRFSVNFFNTEDEISRAVEAIGKLAG